MQVARGQRVLIAICGLAALAAVGCADLDILPSWVPGQGPASDKLPGVMTPAERITELRALSAKAANSTAAEKQRVSEQLAASIRTEKDPLIRMEIIRVLGSYPGPAADAILKAAMNDADMHVRIAACNAWGKRGDDAAIQILAEALQSDVDTDVRMTAAKALGDTRNPAAVAPLGEALADADPAMQYRAVQSLKKASGKDLGNDVSRWQQYVKGEQPASSPSLAERFRQLF